MSITIADVMRRMPGAFLPEKAVGVDARIEFHFTGKEEGSWVATIRDGRCEVEEGRASKATLTLSADSQDYLDVVIGKLNGTRAFMQGKLKLTGDLNLAMKMQSYFDLGEK